MKIIGIIGRPYHNLDNQEIIQLNDKIRKCLSEYNDVTYITILPTNNIHYTDISPGQDILNEIDKQKLDTILNLCDAFIAPGGSTWYNYDEYIIKHAIDNNKPLLAICQGMQTLGSMFIKKREKFDPTIYIEKENHNVKGADYAHKVEIKPNTLLSKILNEEEINVNSYHNYKIDENFTTLITSAVSEDGIIEAIEYPNKKFIVGLQWHPEYTLDNNSKKILDYFIESI